MEAVTWLIVRCGRYEMMYADGAWGSESVVVSEGVSQIQPTGGALSDCRLALTLKYTCVCVWLLKLSAQAGRNTRSFLKQSLTSFHSEFSFFFFGCHKQTFNLKEQSILLHSWKENNRIHNFPEGISATSYLNSLVQVLNLEHSVHFQRLKS